MCDKEVPCGSPAQGQGVGEAEAEGDTPGPLILQELFSESLRLPSASCQGHPVLPTALAHTVCHSKDKVPAAVSPQARGVRAGQWAFLSGLWEAATKSPVLLYKNMKGSCGPPAPPQRKCGVSQVRHLREGHTETALLPGWLHVPSPWLWRMQGPEVVGGLPAVPQAAALPRGATVLAGSHHLFSV